MIHSGSCLDGFFEDASARGLPLVLATVACTAGSTYRKAGAQMLIAADGRSAGLLSGGCLEADLLERARAVLEDGQARLVDYDTRSSDDPIWGIGPGCEGAMTILLTRLDPGNGYQPFAFAAACRRERRAARFALVTRSATPALPLGAAYWPGVELMPRAVAEALGVPVDEGTGPLEPGAMTGTQPLDRRAPRTGVPAHTLACEGSSVLIVPISPPLHLLVLGAGPDAIPLVRLAALMNWHVTVLDHRPAYALEERFPQARRVASRPAGELDSELAAAHYDAAVVMSHHLPSDQRYLEALAASPIGYVGLLGPAPRRKRLLAEIGAGADTLADRLYGPVGLDIGADTPETIALAIVAEIQAVHAGRGGGPFSDVVRRRFR